MIKNRELLWCYFI